MGHGKLARVTEFPFYEHDEGTAEEVAREPDCHEHDYDDRGADDRCQYDCDDCQHAEDRAAELDDDDEDDVRDEQDTTADDDQVDDLRHADDDAVEDGSCARPDCRCPRKFLVSRAVEDLVAEATVARLLNR